MQTVPKCIEVSQCYNPYSGFTSGTPVFAHYTNARWRYTPQGTLVKNHNRIERETKMDIYLKNTTYPSIHLCMVMLTTLRYNPTVKSLSEP